MNNSFKNLFEKMAAASTEQELRFIFMDSVGKVFGVQRWGIYLRDENEKLAIFDVKGVSDAFVERYEKFGKSVDPVLKYVLEYHAPAHEELVLPQGQWKQSELYQRCCAQYLHEHIMTGPIVGNGRLIGTLHFARVGNTVAFSSQDLVHLSSVCTHLSACLASLHSQAKLNPNPRIMHLTKREIQIANLVAKGLTNADIGKQLWISENTVKQALKRMFRKLEVSARTQMVAQLKDILED